MPGMSDPGERLVAAVVAAGHPVEVVPGPSAALAALVVSGLPAGRFVFEGFLPRKGSGRTERLAAVAAEPRTVCSTRPRTGWPAPWVTWWRPAAPTAGWRSPAS